MTYQVMPKLTSEEYSELRADIELRGVMVPIEYDEDGNVLDGYHRLQICNELGIKDFPKVVRAGMTEAEKFTHARKLNMARRHLTGEQKRNLIRDQLKETPEKSDRQIAKSLGVHQSTVGTQRKILEQTGQVSKLDTLIGADGKEYPRQVEHKPVNTALFAGDVHSEIEADTPKVEVQISQEECLPQIETPRRPVSVFNPTRREERALKNPEVVEHMQESGVSPLAASKYVQQEAKAERKAYELSDEIPPDMCRLFVGDIRDGLKEIEDDSVDFIITDPPYPKEYISLYEDLSHLASRVLKPGGSLLVMTGQSYLHEVIHQLCKEMRYHWCMSYLTLGGQSPQLFQKRVNSFWKPVLWYVKGEYKGDYVGDVLKSPVNGNDKTFHKWGQSLGGMIDIIERLTNPGDVILDPFLGGGTTGAAAVSMGRKFIGSDIDQKNIEISEQRIREEYSNAISKGRTNRLA